MIRQGHSRWAAAGRGSRRPLRGKRSGLAARRLEHLLRPDLEVLDARALLSMVSWIAPGSGNWDNGANWSSGSVPGSGDTAVIATAAAATITVQSPDSLVVQSVTIGAPDTLAITGGSLTVTSGTSTLSGPLAMTGGSLTASGAGVSLTAAGTTTLSDASVFASAGADVSLPNAAGDAVTAGAAPTLQASGNNSVLSLPGVTALAVDTTNGNSRLAINAFSGGHVALSKLTTITGPVELSSEGTGSQLDASALTSFAGRNSGNPSLLQVTTGGMLLDGALTAPDQVNLMTDGSGTLATSQWTAFTNATATISGGTLNFSSLANVANSSFFASGGAQVTLGAVTGYTSAVGLQPTFQASGTGTLLALPGLTSLTVDTTNGNSRLAINAFSGGHVALSNVTSITGPVELSSEGTGSQLDASALTSFAGRNSGNPSLLQVTTGGTLLDGALTAPDQVNLMSDGSGTLATSQWTAFTNATATITGGTLNFSSLTNIANSSFFASGGAQVTLGAVTGYTSAVGLQPTLQASGTGTLLALPGLTGLTVDTTNGNSRLAINAFSGGHVALSNVTSITGPVELSSEGTGSQLDASALDSFHGRTSGNPSFLQVTTSGTLLDGALTAPDQVNLMSDGSGTLATSQWTKFTNATATITGGTPNFSSLANVANSSFFASGAAQVTLGAVTGYTSAVGLQPTFQASGTGTLLALPGLTSLTVDTTNGNSRLAINAFSGGHVALSNVTSITGPVELSSEGTGSQLDVSALTSFAGRNSGNPSFLQVTTGGTLLDGALTAPDQVNLMTDGSGTLATSQWTAFTNATATISGGTLNFSSLANVANSSFFASGAAQVTLGAVTGYTSAVGLQSTLQASGTGTLLALPGLTSLTVDTTNGNSRLAINAFSGGHVALSNVTSITGPVELSSEGTGSQLDASALDSFHGRTSGNPSFLQVTTSGTLLDGALTAPDQVNLMSDGSGTLAISQWSAFTNATATISGGTPSFTSLANIANSSFFASGGAQVTLGAVTGYTSAVGLQPTLQASGTGTLLALPGLTSLTVDTTNGNSWLAINAFSGGHVALSNLTTITGPVELSSEGTGSQLDVSALTSFAGRNSGNPSFIQVTTSGTLLDGALTAPDQVNLMSDGSGTLATSQWSAFTNATATISGGTPSFTSLANIASSSFFASGAAQVTLGAVTGYTSAVGAQPTLQASGAGTLLALPGLTGLTVDTTNGNSRLAINAFSGGHVALSNVTSITGPVELSSEGTGSQLDASALDSFHGRTSGNPSFLQVTTSGTLLDAALTAPDQVNLMSDGSGTLATSQWTAFTNATATISGGTPSFSSLSNIMSSSFLLSGGAQVTLGAVTAFTSAVGAQPTFQASGTGTVLALPGLTGLAIDTTNGNSRLEINALSSGQVSLPALTTVTGPVEFLSQGTSSQLDISALSSFQGRTSGNPASIQVTTGGTVLDDALATLNAVNLTIEDASTISTAQLASFTAATLTVMNDALSLPALAGIDGSNVDVAGGGSLTLPALASYTGATGATTTLEASGANSTLVLTNLSSVTVGSNSSSRVQFQALAGGTATLPAIATVMTDSLIFESDGAGSMLNLPSLTSLAGSGNTALATLQATHGGTVVAGMLANLANVSLVGDGTGTLPAGSISALTGTIAVSGGGTLALGAVTNVNNASVVVSGGTTLNLPANTNYTGTAILQASGAGSTLDLAATSLAEPATAGSVLLIEALAGGTVNLPALTAISGGPVVLESTGSGSAINLASLQAFTSSGGGVASGGGAIQSGTTLPAAPDVWVNPGSGTWDTGSNWVLGTVPAAGNGVIITTVAPATITLQGGDNLSVNSVTLGSPDTLAFNTGAQLTTSGNFATAGTVSLAPNSHLAIGGNETAAASATLDEQIGGPSSSGSFGQIAVTGTAALAGTFNLSLLNNFTPSVGDNYPVITFASSTGAFGTINGLGATLTATLESASLNLIVHPAPPTFTADTPTTAAVGSNYSYQFQAGGTPPITFSATGLPAWAQIDPATGIVSGIPPTPGTFNFTVTASNGIAPDATVPVSVTAQFEPPVFIADTPPPAVAGTFYSDQFQATGTGPAPLTYSAAGLPAWAQIDPSTGLFSGTPPTDGTFNFSVTASNGVAPNTTESVSLIAAGGTAVAFNIPAGETFTVPGGTYAGGTTFNVGAGAMVTIPGGTFTGGAIFNVAPGAVVDLTGGGTPSYSGTLIGTGGGTVQLGSGRLFIGAGGLTLNFAGSTLQWNGGTIDAGNGNVTNIGTLNITGNNQKDFYNDGLLNNFGTIIQTGTGNLQLGTDGTFPTTLKNEPGASYLLEGDGGLSEISDSGSAAGQTSLSNAGTIRKTAGSGTSSFTVLGSITNTGTIEADSGTMALDPVLGIAQLTGSTLTAGTWSAQQGASLNFPTGTNITTNAATLALGGSGATIGGIAGLNASSGSLTLSGGAGITTSGNFTTSGTLVLGAGGQLHVTGNETETAAGTLNIQIAGTPASGQFGAVAATGTATLGGTLQLTFAKSFTPQVGQDFPVLTYASASGSFSTAVGFGSIFSEAVNPASLDVYAYHNPADLQVGSVATQAAATTGQPITVTWQVTDQGPAAATGSWQDSVYLSPTAAITPSSTLLGTVEHTGGLAANSTYSGMLTAPVPALPPGSYYVLVQADSLYQVSDPARTNNTQAAGSGPLVVSVPALTPGAPASDAFSAAQPDHYYQVQVAAGEAIVVSLASTASAGATALYVSQGTQPTPYDFQEAADIPNQPNQTVTVPATPLTATYYILAHGVAGAAAAAAYTLTATETAAVGISAISSFAAGNAGNATIEIDGTNFTRSTTATLSLGGASITASSIDYQSASQIFATFNLTGAALGSYTLAVQNQGSSATAATAFQVVAPINPGAPELVLTLPSAVRSGRDSVVSITATNTSNNDILAPLLQLTTDGATLELPSQSSFQGSTLYFLALSPTGPAGILAPGESVQVQVNFQSTTTAAAINFTLNQADDSQTIDWASQEQALQLPSISNAAWPAVFANFVAAVGDTVGSYHAVLAADATYLGALGESIDDVNQLVSFEIEKANAGFSPIAPLAVTDAGLPAPGLALTYTQTYQSTISGRDTAGILGYGWTTNWDISAGTMPNGDVTVQNDGGTLYYALQPDGTYQDLPLDQSVLTVGNGMYTLLRPDGTIYEFNPNGSLDYIQDANGNRITASYNASGQLTSLNQSNGESLTLSYNAQGRLSAIADSTGQTETFGYDATGQFLTTESGVLGTTTYSYVTGGTPQQDNALSEIAGPNGVSEFFTYDPQGRLTGLNENGGAQQETIAYLNPGGYTTTNADGDATTTLYNIGGAVGESIDGRGNVTEYTYDARFDLAAVESPQGTRVTYTYDANGNLLSETDPLGNVTTFTYDSSNNLTSYTDGDGNTTSYAYNSANNLLSVTYASGAQQQYTYNPLGEATQFVDANGNAIGYVYNAEGLITSANFADGTSYTYAYDAHGNLTSAIDAQGNTTTFLYGDTADPNLLTQVTYPNGTFLKFSYNTAGERIQSVDQTGFTVNYAYDSLGELAKLTDGSGNLIVQYTYDSAGLLTGKLMGNGTSTAYTYDADGNVLSITNSAPGGSVNSFDHYTYDALGNVLSDTNQDGQWVYTHDADGQLTDATFTPNAADPDGLTPQVLHYVYDASGNRVSETVNGVTTAYAVNDLNEYTSATTGGVATSYSYDADGNLIGQSTGGNQTTYTYNAFDELTSETAPGFSASYAYDPLGELIAQTVNGITTTNQVDPSGDGNTVAQYDSAGNLLAHYVFGLGLTSQVSGAGSAAYYDFNSIGSTVGLTGASGTYVDSYAYLPFGATIPVRTSVANPFTFVGQSGVATQGPDLFDMRNRVYDADTGQFLSPDPLGLPGGTNLREYAANNPTNYIDPLGLCKTVTIYIWTTGVGHAAIDVDGNYVSKFGSGTNPGDAIYPWNSFPANFSNDQGAGSQKAYTFSVPDSVAEGMQNEANSLKGQNADWNVYTGNCAEAVAQVLRGGYNIPGNVWTPGYLDIYLQTYNLQSNCPPPTPPKLPPGPKPAQMGKVPNVAPADPNALIGPAGYGVQQFIQPAGNWSYTVDFENDGTAAAQDVTVTEQLDPGLDWSTLQLDSFGFGSVNGTIPAGLTQYQTTVAYQNTDGSPLNVQVALTFSVQTGLLRATFTSLDPTTGARCRRGCTTASFRPTPAAAPASARATSSTRSSRTRP